MKVSHPSLEGGVCRSLSRGVQDPVRNTRPKPSVLNLVSPAFPHVSNPHGWVRLFKNGCPLRTRGPTADTRLIQKRSSKGERQEKNQSWQSVSSLRQRMLSSLHLSWPLGINRHTSSDIWQMVSKREIEARVFIGGLR